MDVNNRRYRRSSLANGWVEDLFTFWSQDCDNTVFTAKVSYFGCNQVKLCSAEISVLGGNQKSTHKTSNTVVEKSRRRRTADKLWCLCCGPESKDDMVACDNQSCKTVWFHLGCVGLQHASATEDFWICSRCSTQAETWCSSDLNIAATIYRTLECTVGRYIKENYLCTTKTSSVYLFMLGLVTSLWFVNSTPSHKCFCPHICI